MSKLKLKWREPAFIFDAFQTIVTIVVAIILAADMTGVWSTPWLLKNLPNITFIAVSLLISSSFVERRIAVQQLEDNFNKKLDTITHSLGTSTETLKILADSAQSPQKMFLSNYNSSFLKQPIRSEAKQLLFLATNAASTLPLIKNDLEIGLQRGLEAKFIFIEPFSEAAKMHGFRNRHQSEDEVNKILQINFSTFKTLVKTASPGKLEVRTIKNYLPPYTIYAFDPQTSLGKMYVRLMNFRSSSDSRPVLEVNRKDDRDLFEFFIEQFNLIWKESTPLDLENDQLAKRVENS